MTFQSTKNIIPASVNININSVVLAPINVKPRGGGGGRPGIGGRFNLGSLPVVGNIDRRSRPVVGSFDFDSWGPGPQSWTPSWIRGAETAGK